MIQPSLRKQVLKHNNKIWGHSFASSEGGTSYTRAWKTKREEAYDISHNALEAHSQEDRLGCLCLDSLSGHSVRMLC